MWEPGCSKAFMETIVSGEGGEPEPTPELELIDMFVIGGNSSDGNPTWNIPAHAAGDLIIICMNSSLNNLTHITPTAGGTWTQFSSTGANSASRSSVYWIVDAAGTIDLMNMDWVGNSTWILTGAIYRNAHATVPIGDFDFLAGNGAFAGAITATVEGSHALGLAFWRTNNGTNTVDADWTAEGAVINALSTTSGKGDIARYTTNPLALAENVVLDWTSPFSNNLYWLLEVLPA